MSLTVCVLFGQGRASTETADVFKGGGSPPGSSPAHNAAYRQRRKANYTYPARVQPARQTAEPATSTPSDLIVRRIEHTDCPPVANRFTDSSTNTVLPAALMVPKGPRETPRPDCQLFGIFAPA